MNRNFESYTLIGEVCMKKVWLIVNVVDRQKLKKIKKNSLRKGGKIRINS